MSMSISATGPIQAARSSIPPLTTHLKLQFDGCLRPPRDTGFPTIPHRMAVCAACIGKVDVVGDNNATRSDNNNKNDTFDACGDDDNSGTTTVTTPLAVGAVAIPVSTETTSQHAEYEGLLLGLEWLVEYFSCQTNENGKENYPNVANTSVLLFIEGDCKTVIDQLTGKSIPRKLESLHQRAQDLLDRLSSMDARVTSKSGAIDETCGSVTDDSAGFELKAEVRHVPRNQNPISDSLCNNYMNIIGAKSWIDNIHQLEEIESRTRNGEQDQSSATTGASASSSMLSQLFETTIRTTKHSLRPPLYEMLAELAVETEHYKLLVDIGERLEEEESQSRDRTKRPGKDKERGDSSSSRFPSTAAAKTERWTSTLLKRTSIHYQIRGWKGLGDKKKVRFLERKHRILLSNNDDNGSETDKNKNIYIPEIEESDPEKSRSESSNSKKLSGKFSILKNSGDITEGEWDAVVPDVWKPMLDEWFLSARYNRVQSTAEDQFLPIWEAGTSQNN